MPLIWPVFSPRPQGAAPGPAGLLAGTVVRPPRAVSGRPPLAATSRDTVETALPSRAAIALHDSPACTPRVISSRVGQRQPPRPGHQPFVADPPPRSMPHDQRGTLMRTAHLRADLPQRQARAVTDLRGLASPHVVGQLVDRHHPVGLEQRSASTARPYRTTSSGPRMPNASGPGSPDGGSTAITHSQVTAPPAAPAAGSQQFHHRSTPVSKPASKPGPRALRSGRAALAAHTPSPHRRPT